MHPFPHCYRAQARGTSTGRIVVGTEGAAGIDTDAPPEFGGPGGQWSPETLLVAAIADCYVLTFRAAARASKLPWLSIVVDVDGVLEQARGITRFTRVKLAPRLTLPPGASETLARGVLHQAKRTCLVTNSLFADCELATTVHSVANDEVTAAG